MLSKEGRPFCADTAYLIPFAVEIVFVNVYIYPVAGSLLPSGTVRLKHSVSDAVVFHAHRRIIITACRRQCDNADNKIFKLLHILILYNCKNTIFFCTNNHFHIFVFCKIRSICGRTKYVSTSFNLINSINLHQLNQPHQLNQLNQPH